MEGILKPLLLLLNPYQKENLKLFLLGLLKARSPLLSKISSNLPLKTKRAFYATRRMWRFLSSHSFPSTEIQNFVLSSLPKDFDSPIFFDFSGVEKRGKKFEGKGRFFDSKEGRWKEGFPFLLAPTRIRGRAVPLSVKLIGPHSMEGGRKWSLSLPFIISIMRRFPKAIAVMDKEFSVGRVIRELSLLQIPFILPARRGVTLLTEEGKEEKVGEMEGRNDFFALHKPSGVWLRVLVREDGFTLLTNLRKERKERVFLLYKRRRFVEEAIRQMKEGMRVKEFRVRRFERIKRLFLLCVLCLLLLSFEMGRKGVREFLRVGRKKLASFLFTLAILRFEERGPPSFPLGYEPLKGGG